MGGGWGGVKILAPRGVWGQATKKNLFLRLSESFVLVDNNETYMRSTYKTKQMFVFCVCGYRTKLMPRLFIVLTNCTFAALKFV